MSTTGTGAGAPRRGAGNCAISHHGAAPIDNTWLPSRRSAPRSGASVSALRFYESKGLITSRRTPGNQRRCTRDTPRRVAFVRAAQRVGIPLAAIREALAELPEGRIPTRADRARLSEAWPAELDERIRQLNRLRDHLTDCVGCGCLSLSACVLSSPDDAFGGRRAGSRLPPEPPRP